MIVRFVFSTKHSSMYCIFLKYVFHFPSPQFTARILFLSLINSLIHELMNEWINSLINNESINLWPAYSTFVFPTGFNCTFVYFDSIHYNDMIRMPSIITITSGFTVLIGFKFLSSGSACTVTISMLMFLCSVQRVWFANWPFPDCIEQSRCAFAILYVYICIYICIHVCIYVCTHICMYRSMLIHVYVIYMYVCIS